MRVLACVVVVMAGCKSDDGSTPDTDLGSDTDTVPSARHTQAVVRLDGLEVSESSFIGGLSVALYWEDGDHVGSPYPTLPEDTCEVDTGPADPAPPTSAATMPFGGVVHVDLDGDGVALSNGSGDLGAWPAGQSLTVGARDGDAGDFEIPDFFVVPEPPTGAAVEVLVNSALNVTWGGAPSGIVYVTVIGASGTLRCQVADDGEYMVVPSDLDSVGSSPQVFVARSLEVVEQLPDVDVTGWAFVSASAN